MPTTPAKNLIYTLTLPLKAPSVRGRLRHEISGEPLRMDAYEKLLVHHHVHGASLLISSGQKEACVYTSLTDGLHEVHPDTLFRVASLTKTAVSLLVLRLCSLQALSLDDTADRLLKLPALKGITLRQLLSHTSGLRDTPYVDSALKNHESLESLLATPGIRSTPDFSYCNFGYGVIGCILEAVSGKSIRDVFDEYLLKPAGMRGTIDASGLDENRILPCTRVLPYRKGQEIRRTPLGCIPLDSPDPCTHFGHTAGALYTDARSVRILLDLVRTGCIDGREFIPENLLGEMRTVHAVYGRRSPTLSYGLGLLIISDPRLSSHRLLGHQGLAYGCVNGAFYEEGTENRVVFLNGGCSEARSGMLACSNQDILSFFHKETASWQL